MTVNCLSAQHQLSIKPTIFLVASCTAIATTFLIRIPKEILFLLYWEAWQGMSFVCLALYHKQFLQPWHTQVQIALLFGSYLWTGTQGKVNGRWSLATVHCLLQHLLNKPAWGIPSRQIYWNSFYFFFSWVKNNEVSENEEFYLLFLLFLFIIYIMVL